MRTDPGLPVMMPRRGRVVHQLERVKPGAVLYPYVMACGAATTTVEPAGTGAEKCRRCWPEGAA